MVSIRKTVRLREIIGRDKAIVFLTTSCIFLCVLLLAEDGKRCPITSFEQVPRINLTVQEPYPRNLSDIPGIIDSLKKSFATNPIDLELSMCRSLIKLGPEWRWCADVPFRHKVSMSFGIGRDVSLDLDLAKDVHMQEHVYMFDPTPLSVEYVLELSTKPDWPHGKLMFFPIGLSLEDRPISLFLPKSEDDPQLTSEFQSERYTDSNRTKNFPAYTLKTLRSLFKIECLDLLKVDIEGHESQLIQQWADDGSFECVQQFCAEYHNFDVTSSGHSQSIHITNGILRKLGFRQYFVSKYRHYMGSNLVESCYYRPQPVSLH